MVMYNCPNKPLQTPAGLSNSTTCKQLCSLSIPNSAVLLCASFAIQILFVMFEAAAYMHRGANRNQMQAQQPISLASFKSA
jgi:hypothetical protein